MSALLHAASEWCSANSPALCHLSCDLLLSGPRRVLESVAYNLTMHRNDQGARGLLHAGIPVAASKAVLASAGQLWCGRVFPLPALGGGRALPESSLGTAAPRWEGWQEVKPCEAAPVPAPVTT